MLNEIFWGGENIALKCAWRHVDIVAKFIIEFHLSSHRTLDAADCPDIPVHRWLISGCQKLWELPWAQNAPPPSKKENQARSCKFTEDAHICKSDVKIPKIDSKKYVQATKYSLQTNQKNVQEARESWQILRLRQNSLFQTEYFKEFWGALL